MDLFASHRGAPFTVFHRTLTGEGGFTCAMCDTRRHGDFARSKYVLAAALGHLHVCRAATRSGTIEGVAILDGKTHAVVLRDGLLIVSVETASHAISVS